MFNTDPPQRADLPSAAQLVRSTIAAAAVAAAILALVVLPSEYAIDPTGIGRLLGLTPMGEIKMQLAAEAAAEAAASAAVATRQPSAAQMAVPGLEEGTPAPEEGSPALEESSPATADPAPGRSDEVRFTLRPGQGAEYKLVMRSGASARFSWVSDGGPVNVDAHGSAPGQRISYGILRGIIDDEGDLEAAFDGDHGWFFRNRSGGDVTVTLRTTGDYTELKKVL